MTTITKYITIALFSPRGTTCVIYQVGGTPKKFASIQAAVEYIEANNLGASASPVEVYEE